VPVVRSKPTAETDWPFITTARAALAPGDADLDTIKRLSRAGDADLAARFAAGDPVDELVRARAALVDLIIRNGWSRHLGDATGLSLIAVGGYGRGELHPASDVDVLVLCERDPEPALKVRIEAFVGALWDVGLDPGHSVRSLPECVNQARDDITVMTGLMEARLLAGDPALLQRLREATAPDRLWPSDQFFAGKLAEQQARHLRFDDTAYNLEPNVKEGPGGLRDIQNVAWVLKRHFGARDLSELVGHQLLTRREFHALHEGQQFLWRVRFALHAITGRREERLLFDHQIQIAEAAGYADGDGVLAVEAFMQDYYRQVFSLALLNDVLLQLFRERILHADGDVVTPLDATFARRGRVLMVTDPGVFAEQPGTLLDLFKTMQRHPDLDGVAADTVRAVQENLHRIDDAFRQHPANRQRFLDILRGPDRLTHELRRMGRYGVLGRFLPAFGQIVGRMQFDLFHAYTVDAHTLFVVGNLRRFVLPRYAHEFPRCNEVMSGIAKPELLYLAGLFHDIAKGRGGDHSELGALEAERFCLQLGLSPYDAGLVAWLVRNHLLLSMIAQKQDIADPPVVSEFARRVGDQTHLDHLYLLTMADVRGTNPKLWNSWKAALFEELYERTSEALRRGLADPVDKETLLAETREHAMMILAAHYDRPEAALALWDAAPEDYLLRHNPDELAWHAEALLRAGPDATDAPAIVLVRTGPARAGTSIFIHAPAAAAPFVRVTAALDDAGLSILDARISTDDRGRSLETYVVLDRLGEPLTDPEIVADLKRRLQTTLAATTPLRGASRRVPRQVRLFPTATVVGTLSDPDGRWTVLDLVTGDRPGLLSELAALLDAQDLRLVGARISTVGERAEDVFTITDDRGQPLDTAHAGSLAEAVRLRLGERGD
jgi:[protein-PII] uridylyltransferase